MKNAYYLSAGDVSEPIIPAITLGQGYPTHKRIKIGDEEKDVPCAYFWKDAIAVGDYVHPTTGQKLSVDGKRIDAWVKNFHAMRKAGVDIPTPADHSSRAKDNLGFVLDAKRNGDRLSVLHQTIGEPAALVALRNRCSLCIEENYTDERGRKWGDAFTHSAYTPKPVVTGMGEFTPFAASRDGDDQGTPIYYLSAEQGDPEMDSKQLREALGVAADVPDDKLIDQVKTLRTEHKANADKVATLSRTQVTPPAKPSATELFFASKAVTSAREDAIRAGAITPATADVAEKTLLSKPVEPGKITLSRAVEDDDHKIVDGYAKLLDFYAIVKDNKPAPASGSQTGVQSLSRNTPGGEKSAEAKAVEEDADAQAKAYREQRGIKD